MSIYPEHMHQPPNPADLERTPPASPDCARVRGMLRDYVDGDLTTAEAGAVDDHVASCRVCSVELARAEHELLRVRKAFRASAAGRQPTLRPDFASRVVEQLVLTEPDVGPVSTGPVSIGRALVAQRGVRVTGQPAAATVSKDERSSTVAPGGRFALALICTVAAALLLAVGARLMLGGSRSDRIEAELQAMLSIVEASDAVDDRSRRLVSGDQIGEHQSLWVSPGGSLKIHWRDHSNRAQPAATIQVREGGEVALRNGAPYLLGGRMVVETHREVQIPMDDVNLSFGIGKYVVAANIPFDLEASNLHPDGTGFGDPFGAGLAGNVDLEIEVLDGKVEILKAGGATNGQVVAMGNRAIIRGNGSVDVAPFGPVASGGQVNNRVDAQPEPPVLSPRITGAVRGPVGQAVPDAYVALWFAKNGQRVSDFGLSSGDGSFSILVDDPCEADFAIMLGRPKLTPENFGVVVPQPVPISRNGNHAYLPEGVRVNSSAMLNGVVVDQAGERRSGVRIVPCIIDELFDLVWELPYSSRSTDLYGSFSMAQLPTSLPPHQRMVLVAVHDDLQVTVVTVPKREHAGLVPPVEIVAQELVPVEVEGLQPSTTVSVYEEVPGLPAGSAAVVRRLQTNGSGFAQASFGAGRQWLLTANQQKVTPLFETTGYALRRFKPGPIGAEPIEQRFRALSQMSETDVKLVQSNRFDDFEARSMLGAASAPVLRVLDSNNMIAGRSQVFALRRSSCRGQQIPRFLGFTMDGRLPLMHLEEEESLMVIGASGELGWLDAENASGTMATVTTTGPGRIWIGPSLRPTDGRQVLGIAMRRQTELVPGIRPDIVRFASSGTGWSVEGVPPGDYDVMIDGEPFTVNVPPNGSGTLGQ